MSRIIDGTTNRAPKLLACTAFALLIGGVWSANAGEDANKQPNELSRFGLTEDCNNKVPRLKIVSETGDFKLWESANIRKEKGVERYVLTTKGVVCNLVVEQRYYSGKLPPALYIPRAETVHTQRGIVVGGIKVPYFGNRRMMRKSVRQFLKNCLTADSHASCKLQLQDWVEIFNSQK